MDTKQAYQEKYEAQLREWGAKVEVLRAKVDRAKAEAKIEYLRQLDELRGKQDAARQELETLISAGEGAWEDLRAGAERAWNEFQSAVESAAKRFR